MGAVMEKLGAAAGLLLAPVTGAVSLARRARMFHPEGAVYAAEVTVADGTPWPAVAGRLAGPALVRVSSAWWRGGVELPDVLGLAVRLGGDQDLLLATIRRPWTTPFAPLSTRVHDFLENDYYGVSPFSVDGIGRVYLRAVGSRPHAPGPDRGARFQRAVEEGSAGWRLEARRAGERRWQALVEISARERVEVDQAALRFWPFRDGRGLHPRGFVHALRRAAYRASWSARPHRSP